MSVLIKGMKMPTNCWDCPIRNSKPCPCKGYSTALEYVTERHADCPLVHVPYHGDLIDRDRLEKDIDKYIGGEESRSRFHHWVQVQDAVIPMDKGEEK